MSLLSQRSGLVALVLSTAFVLAVGCSSGNNKKKVVYPADDGGAAGATAPSENAAGASGTAEVGAAGESGAAQGGASGEAGAAQGGEAGASAGAAGESSLSCTPSGSVTGITLSTEPIYKACRGAIVLASFNATASDASFTCCGISNTASSYELELSGVSNGDGGGDLALAVPLDAPIGAQTISAVCNETQPPSSIALEVTDVLVPAIQAVTAQITPAGNLTITGLNLGGVTYVGAVSTASKATFDCAFSPTSATNTSVVCNFDGAIAPGSYNLVVYQQDCGYSPDSASFSVVPASP